MCGRFFFISPLAELEHYLPEVIFPDTLPLRYNIAPTQQVPVLIHSNGKQQFELFHWGLIPSWAKDTAIGNRLINARAETLSEKPSFRSAFRRRRCVVLASGFYEWSQQPNNRRKTPYAFRLRSGAPMLLAGLWEVWQPAEGDAVRSCTIITTNANAILERFHDRMPVLLEKKNLERWLDPADQQENGLQELLHPYADELMQANEVSVRVNNVRYDAPDCLERD